MCSLVVYTKSKYLPVHVLQCSVVDLVHIPADAHCTCSDFETLKRNMNYYVYFNLC